MNSTIEASHLAHAHAVEGSSMVEVSGHAHLHSPSAQPVPQSSLILQAEPNVLPVGTSQGSSKPWTGLGASEASHYWQPHLVAGSSMVDPVGHVHTHLPSAHPVPQSSLILHAAPNSTPVGTSQSPSKP